MKHRLTSDETAYFCEQLAMILNAGIPLSDGFEILCEDAEDKKITALCNSMLDELNHGEALSQAMESSKAFPEYSIKMVKIGEMTGKLESVLHELSGYYESRAELARAVRSSVLHPLMLLVMMTVVVIVLITMVLPMFGEIFSQFDSSIGSAVAGTVDTAYTVGTVMMFVLLGIILVCIVVAVLSQIPGARSGLLRFVAVFPLTRKMSRRFALSKISDAISMMVASGIAPDELLQYAADLVDDKILTQKLLDCRQRVLDGEFFAEVISSSGIFPSLYAHSLKIAYSSGSFEKAWKKLADKCDESAMDAASGIVAFIEPAIVIILTTVIGAVLLTVMIPLMNIMSVMG